jgi:hypothetical protein
MEAKAASLNVLVARPRSPLIQLAVSVARFCSLLFAALALAPALAHLLELYGKMGLSREDYLTVQQIYRGWALLGFVVFAALFSTLGLTVPGQSRDEQLDGAARQLAGTRTQWEYSHAASAVLNFIALIAVILSVLAPKD